MNLINIPHSCQHLSAGSIVILGRFPETRWVLKNGWYIYDSSQYNGWYFSSIPANSVLPLEESDLLNLTIVSEGEENCHCSCSSIKPRPICIEVYLKGIGYKKGQVLWLESEPGNLYQVAENFTSSYSEETVKENLKKDIDSGCIIPVTYELISGSSLTFALNFKKIFGSDTLTIEQTDAYLAQFKPTIKPQSGISFVNVDQTSPTFSYIYEYCTGAEDFEMSDLALVQVYKNGEHGPQGKPGLSAYEIALSEGYEGTEQEWLASLKGEKGETGESGSAGPEGPQGEAGLNGVDGLSAYDIALKNGFEGTESEWLASLKGETGEKGDKGETGPQGATGEQGLKGDTGDSGLSAYEVAKANGFIGTESEWLESLKGDKGETGEQGLTGEAGQNGTDGMSAYDIWLSLGNTGTESDFIDSLKGPQGESGIIPEDFPIILTDTVTETKYKLEITNGQLYFNTI